MPRIVKSKPPTLPIFQLFHLRPHVWDAIAEYAYKHNRVISSVMQDFLEVGLLEYLKYDSDLLHKFNQRDIPLTAPATHEYDYCEGFL